MKKVLPTRISGEQNIWPLMKNQSIRQRIKPLGVALLAATLTTACGSDDDNTIGTINSEEFIGTWISAEDGQALTVESNKITGYQFTSGHCLMDQSATGKLADLSKEGWVVNDTKDVLTQQSAHLGSSYINISYTKADELPAQCAEEQLIVQYFEEDYEADPTQDYQIFWDTFNEYYPSFARRDVDWNAVNTAFSGQVTQDMTKLEFLELMAQMVEPLEDAHISLSYDDNEASSFMRGETFDDRLFAEFISSDEVDGDIDTVAEQQAYIAYITSQYQLMNEIRISYATSEIKQAANDELLWYTVTEDGSTVGVLIINAMDGFIEDADEAENLAEIKADMDALEAGIVQALNDLKDTDGLIIDVRDNPGGHDANSQVLVRHFMDTERTLYSKQSRLGNDRTEPEVIRLTPAELTYTKPVVVLTSPMTESAAEIFSLAMRELPQVTVIGEPTQGAMADVLSKKLPNGIEFALVNEYYLSNDGDWFEGQGIPVAVNIPFMTLEERDEEKDLGLETAWEILLAD